MDLPGAWRGRGYLTPSPSLRERTPLSFPGRCASGVWRGGTADGGANVAHLRRRVETAEQSDWNSLPPWMGRRG